MFERNKSKQSEPPAAPPRAREPESREARQSADSPQASSTRSAAMIGPSIEIKGTVTGDANKLFGAGQGSPVV